MQMTAQHENLYRNRIDLVHQSHPAAEFNKLYQSRLDLVHKVNYKTQKSESE